MKKIISIFIILIFLFSSACAELEYNFQNIPWLSDDENVFHALNDAGFIRDGVTILPFSNNNAKYIVENDIGFISPDKIMGVEEVTFVANLNGIIKGKIAGYPLKNILLTFAYNGNYMLVAVEVELIGATYDEVKSKLIKEYGECEQKATEEGIESCIWKGENNSAILLYTQSEGYKYTFMYGRLDAAEILKECLQNNPNDTSGL